jgi:anhydro-N-acetylmuramic acid kinase
LHRAWLAGNALARTYAVAVAQVVRKCGIEPDAVRAIGAHGQTVRHRPQEFDGTGYTIQLNQPALLAELTGIDVVADFRSRDVAAGGQGAPLVPPFHQAFFGDRDHTAILNLGGIANLTILFAEGVGQTYGYDCGPGNALMDAWCARHLARPYDEDGLWARGGRVIEPLLQHLLTEPFFAKPPPKSTGRDLFHEVWLDAHLTHFPEVGPQDVQSTLTELTAIVAATGLRQSAPECATLIVCGGGALNIYLMERLRHAMQKCHVASSEAFGLPPLQVEALAFAWLAKKTLAGLTGNSPYVTGATGQRILGATYKA